jgi:hypothetical protein
MKFDLFSFSLLELLTTFHHCDPYQSENDQLSSVITPSHWQQDHVDPQLLRKSESNGNRAALTREIGGLVIYVLEFYHVYQYAAQSVQILCRTSVACLAA